MTSCPIFPSFFCFWLLDNVGQEKHMIARFAVEMERVEKVARRKIIFRGLVNSFSQAIPFLAYTAALCYGGFMVANDEIHYKYIIRYVNLVVSIN